MKGSLAALMSLVASRRIIVEDDARRVDNLDSTLQVNSLEGRRKPWRGSHRANLERMRYTRQRSDKTCDFYLYPFEGIDQAALSDIRVPNDTNCDTLLSRRPVALQKTKQGR